MLFLSCLTLSEELLCHTIHAADCRPQVSHTQICASPQMAELSINKFGFSAKTYFRHYFVV